MTTPYEEGYPSSKICVLGEAPSYMEIRQSRPFVGPAGQLLEECMHRAKMVRKECYITNVFEFEVAKRDNGATVVSKQSGERLWTAKGGFTEQGLIAAGGCIQRLRTCKANVIVPLGGIAAAAALRDMCAEVSPDIADPRLISITKLRGSILQSEFGKIVPAIHPAASLRGQYIWRHLITTDLGRVKEQSAFPEIRRLDRSLYPDPSHKEALDFLDQVAAGAETAFDTELVNHHIYSVAYSLSPTEVMCIPFVDVDGGPRWTEEEELALWEAIERVQTAPTLLKIGQNTMFDVSVMLKQNSILTAAPIADLMIAHHIVWPDLPKGLDFITSVHTEEPYYKDEGKQWNKVDNPMKFRLYNCKDSAVTHEAWLNIQERLDNGYRQTYDETMEMFPVCLFMMQRGMKVDRERLEITKKEIEALIAEKEAELLEAADKPFNPLSPKQCIEYFYGHKGLKPYISRSTGNPTTDDKALSRIYRRYKLPEAKIAQEIRTYKKLYGTYLDVGIDSDSRVRCFYNLRGTVTGRPSSSQTLFGTGMNMQNLHPQFKSFLVADEG